MGDDPVLYEKSTSGLVAIVTLNRPEVLNAYDITMRDALFGVFEALRDDREVRAMILRGAGRAFCSGGDVREFGAASSPVAARRVRWQRDVWGLFSKLPQVKIAAVHGCAVGSGFEMVLLCDLCVAANDAWFALPETTLGLIPGVAGTQTLPRWIGTGRALDVILTGTRLSAREAARLGIVARVVPAKQVGKAAVQLAELVVENLLRAQRSGACNLPRARTGGNSMTDHEYDDGI